MPGPSEQYQNILIIKPGAVGDLLQMTPVIRALSVAFPRTRITLLVGSELTAALFRNDSRVFETIVVDRGGRHRSWKAMLGLWNALRAKRYDLVLNFQRSNIRSWFLASAAFPCRVLVYHKTRGRIIHAVENYLETITPLDIPAAGLDLELFLDDPSRTYARELFSAHGLGDTAVIALNPGATHAVNRWPAARFAELADLIASSLPAKVIIVGGPDDAALSNDIIDHSRSKPLSLAGKTSLLQLGAVLETCTVLVSGDTGPLHLATAVGTRTVALFGAADPARTGPVGAGHRVIQASGVECAPCRSRRCGNRHSLECMERISAREVADAVASVLDRT